MLLASTNSTHKPTATKSLIQAYMAQTESACACVCKCVCEHFFLRQTSQMVEKEKKEEKYMQHNVEATTKYNQIKSQARSHTLTIILYNSHIIKSMCTKFDVASLNEEKKKMRIYLVFSMKTEELNKRKLKSISKKKKQMKEIPCTRMQNGIFLC